MLQNTKKLSGYARYWADSGHSRNYVAARSEGFLNPSREILEKQGHLVHSFPNPLKNVALPRGIEPLFQP